MNINILKHCLSERGITVLSDLLSPASIVAIDGRVMSIVAKSRTVDASLSENELADQIVESLAKFGETYFAFYNLITDDPETYILRFGSIATPK